MAKVVLIALAVALVACGSGMSGEYGGEGCLYNKLSFKGDGTVYVKVLGSELAGQYKVDGDKVILSLAAGHGQVLTRRGDTLIDGNRICKKL